MNILLTGGNGMLGSSISEKANEIGSFLVVSTDIKTLDITDRFQVEKYIDKYEPAAIINCAAYANVDGCETNQEAAYKVNSFAPGILSELADKYSIKLCHISTDYVYKSSENKFKTEEDPRNPLSVYGKSKLDGEKNIINNTFRYFILRTSWMFSYYGNNFLKWVCNSVKQKIPVNLICDNWGNPTYSIDLADIILKILPTESYGIYNASNDGYTNWYDFGNYIIEKAGLENSIKKVSYKDLKRKAVRPVNSVMDISKLKKTFNIEVDTWKKAVELCLEKYPFVN